MDGEATQLKWEAMDRRERGRGRGRGRGAARGRWTERRTGARTQLNHNIREVHQLPTPVSCLTPSPLNFHMRPICIYTTLVLYAGPFLILWCHIQGISGKNQERIRTREEVRVRACNRARSYRAKFLSSAIFKHDLSVQSV